MWKTDNLGVAKMVAWAWANYPAGPLNGQKPHSVVRNGSGYEVVVGEKDDAVYVVRPGDAVPVREPAAVSA